MTEVKDVLFCTALLVAVPAYADQAVRTEVYSPQSRTSLVIQQGRVTNITFNVMERIKRIVAVEPGPISTLGKDNANQEPLVNNLPIFGNSPGTTNLVVITLSPDGMERSYLFTVRVVPTPPDGGEDPAATFGLTFSYPKGVAPAEAVRQAATPQVALVSWKQKQTAKDKETVEERLNSDVFFGPQNLKYLAQGTSRDIAPVSASDNGRLTAFRYPGNLGVPSVFVVQDAKPGIPDVCTTGRSTDNQAPEQTVQATIDGDVVVVQRTAAHFRLRAGTDVIEIYNCGYDPIGQKPGTGTSSPDVVRRVITSQ
jgi:type IV secretory pathway VirB9-like protein